MVLVKPTTERLDQLVALFDDLCTGRLISASEILIRTRGDSFQTVFPISGDSLTQRLRSMGDF